MDYKKTAWQYRYQKYVLNIEQRKSVTSSETLADLKLESPATEIRQYARILTTAPAL